MDRTQKQAFVQELNKELSGASAMVVAHYRGLTVKQMTELRRAVSGASTRLQVSKNRLAKLAFKGTSFEGLNDLLTGPTVMAYGQDALAATKIVQQFADKNDKLIVLGGQMDDKVLSADEVKSLSRLPSLDELRGTLVGLLQAPGAQLARVTKAYADKDGVIETAEAPAAEAELEAPAAEAEAPVAEAAAPEAAPEQTQA